MNYNIKKTTHKEYSGNTRLIDYTAKVTNNILMSVMIYMRRGSLAQNLVFRLNHSNGLSKQKLVELIDILKDAEDAISSFIELLNTLLHEYYKEE